MTYTPSMDDVKALRAATLAGLGDCKKALIENEGDMEKAKDWLRAKGLAAAAKRADRAASEGLIRSYHSADGTIGSLVEVNCETDFVARNGGFIAFVEDLARLIVEDKPTGLEDTADWNVPGESLLNKNWHGDPQVNVGDKLGTLVATIGEKMGIKRYARFDLGGTPGAVVSYIHMGGKVGVLLEVVGATGALGHPGFAEFGKDIAMHIAASQPDYVAESDIPADVIERERNVAEARTREEGKPENVIPNIVAGRVKKWISEVVLGHQPFVKDPEQTIDKYLQAKAKEFGGELKVRRFARFALGG